MNDRARAIVEEAQKLTPQERLELLDLLEATFAGDGSSAASRSSWTMRK